MEELELLENMQEEVVEQVVIENHQEQPLGVIQEVL